MSALLVAERDVLCVHVCTRVQTCRACTSAHVCAGEKTLVMLMLVVFAACVLQRWSALPAVVQKMRGQHRDEDVLPVHGKEQSGGAVDTRR